MFDHSNKENLFSNHNIVIPKPISSWKRSQSNIDRKDFKNVIPTPPESSLKNGIKPNQIIKIKKNKFGSIADNLARIDEAFKSHTNTQLSNVDSQLYTTELKQYSTLQPDYAHNYLSVPGNQKDIKNYQSQPSIHQTHSDTSPNTINGLNSKITQIQNSNLNFRKDIQVPPLSSIQTKFNTKPLDNFPLNTDSNFNKQKSIQSSNFQIHLPQTIAPIRQQPTFFENTRQPTLLRPQYSTGNLLNQEDQKQKINNNLRFLDNLNEITDESGIKKNPHCAINRSYLNDQTDNNQINTSQLANTNKNNLSNTNTFNFTNNNINNNNNNNLSAFFEQSTVCFNSTENDDANNLIRVFDKHMQEKQDLFRIQLETGEILGETNHNSVTNTCKLNGENTLIFDEKVFTGNTAIYQEAEYVIFKNTDFNRLLLKQEAIQELLVQQQMKIKQLENQLIQQNGIERIEQKQQMLMQIQQDLQNNDRVSRFNSRGSEQSSKLAQFNSGDTDFKQNQKSFIKNANIYDASTNKYIPTEKDEDCKSINNITDILNMQTDESHSQFDLSSIHARKSSNTIKYNSNALESNYQTNIPRLQLQNQNFLNSNKTQSNMLQTFGQSPNFDTANKDNKQIVNPYFISNMNLKKIPESHDEQQQSFKSPDVWSHLKSSTVDQSRIVDENEEGVIRQSIKETCRNRIIQGQNQEKEMIHNCFIDGVETFRGNQNTALSIQNNQSALNVQSMKTLEFNSQLNSKPPKIPCGKKIFSERSEYTSIQNNINIHAGLPSGNCSSNFSNTDRSHNTTTQVRSKSLLGIQGQIKQNDSVTEKYKINTQSSEDTKQNSEKYNTTQSTLPSNNTHHFRSHGEFDNNSSLNRQGSQQNIGVPTEDQNCAIF